MFECYPQWLVGIACFHLKNSFLFCHKNTPHLSFIWICSEWKLKKTSLTKTSFIIHSRRPNNETPNLHGNDLNKASTIHKRLTILMKHTALNVSRFEYNTRLICLSKQRFPIEKSRIEFKNYDWAKLAKNTNSLPNSLFHRWNLYWRGSNEGYSVERYKMG